MQEMLKRGQEERKQQLQAEQSEPEILGEATDEKALKMTNKTHPAQYAVFKRQHKTYLRVRKHCANLNVVQKMDSGSLSRYLWLPGCLVARSVSWAGWSAGRLVDTAVWLAWPVEWMGLFRSLLTGIGGIDGMGGAGIAMPCNEVGHPLSHPWGRLMHLCWYNVIQHPVKQNPSFQT